MDRERSKWVEIPTPGHKKTRRRQPDRSRNLFLMKMTRFKAFRTLSTLLNSLASLIPIALHLFFDNIMFGLDKAKFDNFSIVSCWINSDATSKTEVPELLSETTSFPPLLSSDIALSIFIVNVLWFIRHFFVVKVNRRWLLWKKNF